MRLRNLLRPSKILVFLVAAFAALGIGVTAWAYFTSTGAGAGTANVGYLNAPTNVVATPGAGTVALSWSPVSVPSGTVYYYVTRDGGAPAGTCATQSSPTTATACVDSGLTAGVHNYLVTAVWQSWTATSSPAAQVTLASGAASQIVLSGGSSLASGSSETLTATIEDATGNTVTSGTDSTATVTFAQTTGTGSVTGLSTSAASGGVATESITGKLAGLVNLTATAALSGPGSTTSNVLGVTVNPGALASFSVSPSSGTQTSGTAFNETLTALDAAGNTKTDYTGSVTLTSNDGSAVLPTPNPYTFTTGTGNDNGVHTFSVTLLTAGTGKTVTFADGTISTTGTFTVNPGAANAAQSTLTPTSASITANGTSTQVLTVQAEDANGNNLTTGGATVAITKSSGTGTIGSVTDNGNGTYSATVTSPTATGTGVFVATLGGAPVKSGTSSQTTSTISYVPGVATKLVFTTQPVGGVTEGTNFTTQPQVSVEDVNGNVVTSDTGNVTLAINSYSAGTSGGSTQGVLACGSALTVAASSGVATFAGCNITGTAAAGTYTLVATRSGLTSTAASNNVVITPGTATKLLFTTQPNQGQNIQAKGTGSFNVTAQVQDVNGNLVTTSSASVGLAITSGTGATGATLSCTNSGGTTLNASGGTAAFTGCAIDKVGSGYTLTATSNGLTSAVSNTFNITPGTATQLVFTQQPNGGVGEGAIFPTQPSVSVEDVNGNVVTSDTGNVTLAINTYSAGTSGGSSKGTLACTSSLTVAASSGVASFTGCNITGTAAAGTYTLVATRSGLTSTAASNSVVITSGSASKLAFTTQPIGGVGEGTSFTTQPQVSVEDTDGNVVTSDTGNVTLAINSYSVGTSGGSVQGTLACTSSLTVAAASGVASFTGCNITGTAAAGTYTLVATRSGLTPTAASNSVVINAGIAAKYLFTNGSVSGAASSPVGANLGLITVQEQDSYGNVSTTAETVSLSSTSSSYIFNATQFASTPVGTRTMTISSGSSSVSFYYGDANVASPTITAHTSGLTDATQTEIITTAPAGLGIVTASSGSTGTPVISCGSVATSYTCNVTGVTNNGHITFYVTFVNSSGTPVVYSSTQSSTITETGQNNGTVTISAGASSSSPNTLTASHTGTTKTSTLKFGPYTLIINVSS